MSNRRYTGSKKALLEEIRMSVGSYLRKGAVFADVFAGTGVVSAAMLEQGMNAIVNDILRSNYVAYEAWFGSGKYNPRKLERIIREFNELSTASLPENYFSDTYGGKYFSVADAKKIGYIRDRIETISLTLRERSILITSLMYAADKIANTVGHFEHFLSTLPRDRGILMRMPKIDIYSGVAELYNIDANALARTITCDVAYLDPPYNARQYVNFYHVLENLVRWDKPTEFEGVSMKFKRNELKSEYSRKHAPDYFRDLIDNLDARKIITSYSNTYSAKSTASNNKISPNQLMEILSARGVVEVREIKHKSFNSGQTDFVDHKELLYICTIR